MAIENPLDVTWWIAVVEIPALAGLFWLIWRNKRDCDGAREQSRLQMDREITKLRQNVQVEMHALRDGLAGYKLEVAKSYASIALLKDVESRLTAHLLRIERKLEASRGS